ncbi:hypothetical protein CCAX7_63740 [Capsulimonas corticalis]|uniref:Uncharacterized protein n=1 Tax=Capsulimonas corticalis TaxID=2219043 RepID=A0A402CX05_9BACT|nr:DUF1003 domain-containing protein [Capsulimonas corticalis]BDI34323.1 hypothetical protein CCAX7_63740 [Capsulimonas corticalis]
MNSQIDPVTETTDMIAAIYQKAEDGVDWHQRSVERVVATLGRPMFLYVVLGSIALWIGYNELAPREHWRLFDSPPFSWLQGCISLGGLLIAIVILISQNRQGKLAESRAQLDLQVNLLAEQKVAKLIALVEELRRDLPSVRDRRDLEAEAMASATNPEQVLAALEEKVREAAPESQGPLTAAVDALRDFQNSKK